MYEIRAFGVMPVMAG